MKMDRISQTQFAVPEYDTKSGQGVRVASRS